MSQATEFARTFLEDLLSFFGLNTAIEAKQQENTIELDVPSTHLNGFLIGSGGEGLRSLQQITNMAIKAKGYDDLVAVIDVAGYKRQRNERLSQQAQKIAQTVRAQGQEQPLEPMSAYDRRIVHQAVSEIGSVTSESSGEGRDRHVVIKPQPIEEEEAD